MRKMIMMGAMLGLAACAVEPSTDTVSNELVIDGSAWDRITVRAIGGTGTATMGADGVDIAIVNGEPAMVTPWEQGGAVTVDALDGTPLLIVDTLPGGEDAKLYDMDVDGFADAVSASQGLKKIKIRFGGANGTWPSGILINAATNLSKWLQMSRGDMDGDGHADLVAGGDVVYGNGGVVNLPGRLGYFTTTNARSASAWAYHEIVNNVGRAMTVEARDLDGDQDVDLYITNREGATGFVRGAHAFENDGAGNFTEHLIAQISGDPGMGWIADFNGDGLIDEFDGNRDTLSLRWGTASWTWSTESVPFPTTSGEFHAVTPCDVDGDGTTDYVVTTALADAGEDGVYWLQRAATGQWTAHAVSGPDTVVRKFDEPECVDADGDGDVDIEFAEGGDGCPANCTNDLGTGYYRNPRFSPRHAPRIPRPHRVHVARRVQ